MNDEKNGEKKRRKKRISSFAVFGLMMRRLVLVSFVCIDRYQSHNHNQNQNQNQQQKQYEQRK